ncbi:hypothetical protein GWK47_022887 [Chionoecetes opilio]|uniref:Uncharacterized protein n=1 Tax=Chionoecetes opilio TaxID=41210 RepID=A0A8J4XRW4_CHIOP|nr:hypothetical protein GWK47_022887 [Chionoecetes opilio]
MVCGILSSPSQRLRESLVSEHTLLPYGEPRTDTFHGFNSFLGNKGASVSQIPCQRLDLGVRALSGKAPSPPWIISYDFLDMNVGARSGSHPPLSYAADRMKLIERAWGGLDRVT